MYDDSGKLQSQSTSYLPCIELSGDAMRGVCTSCDRKVGDKQEYGILFTEDDYPISACCHVYVLIFDEGEENEGRGD